MLFGQVRLHKTVGVFRPQCAQCCQLIGSRGGRKPWRNRVMRAAPTVPFAYQRFAVVIGRLRAVAQIVRRVAIHTGFASHNTHVPRCRRFKERIY